MEVNNYFDFDISKYCTDATFFSGQTIVKEGNEFEKLIFIESGTAKCLETQENGVVNLISYLVGPSFLGDIELVGARKSTNGVVAVTDCKCSIIDVTSCKDDILKDVKFLKFLCYNFALKAVNNGKNITMGNSYPLKNRLATFLIDTSNNGLYTIPHTESSSYLGVSYRHLLYVLAQFVDEGILEKSKSGYKIINREELEKLYIHQMD